MTQKNNIQHRLLLNPTLYALKPSEEEVKRRGTGINDKITRYPVNITAKELAIAIVNGQTWIASYIKGKRCNENWKSQSIFALDFDNSEPVIDTATGKNAKDPTTGKTLKKQVDNPISFTQVLERLREYGLDCTFGYNTFSHSENWHKFRVVFQLNRCIIDNALRGKIQLALLCLFPEADNCKDACRLWHGTNKELIYENYDYCLDLPNLRDSGVLCASSHSDKSNVARKMKSIADKLDFDEKCVNPLYIKGNTQNSSEINESEITNEETYHYFLDGSRYYSEVYAEVLKKGHLDNVDFSELAKKVRILSDFMNHTIKLDHNLLKGLATNLKWLKGGQALYRECINANPNYDQDKHTIMTFCRTVEYIPMQLDTFSPYEEDWEYINLLQAARLPRGEVIRKEIYQPMTLKKGELMLNDAFKRVRDDTSNSIWIIKKATGLGGTEKLLDLEGVTIAFPNHALKEEVARRFKVPHISTPELPLEAISPVLRRKIEYLYEIGLERKVHSLIQEYSVNNPALGAYLGKTSKAYASKQTVLTTHTKALFVDFEHHDTVVFDEDPLASILQIGKVSLNDLNNLIHLTTNTRDKEKLKQYAAILTSSMSDCIESNKEFIFDDLEAIEETILDNRNFDSSILKFIRSQHYAKDSQSNSILRFITHTSLNSDVLAHKKIIIISATANELIYKKLYGNRVKFIDISNVEMAGMVIQNTQYSCSRSRFTLEIREKIKEKVSHFKHLITFAPYKHYFPNAVEDVHYGKCTGFDGLKGENIAVVGTPHLKHIDYLLYAKALGLQVCPQDFRMELRRVEHNGYEFRFQTFVKPELQLIQFHFIEEQMIQAIGRARLLRIPGEVMLFSNYPLPFSRISELEIAQGRRQLEARKLSCSAKSDWESRSDKGLAA